MSKGTAPAWQVRESQRQKLLEGIQWKIIRKDEKLGVENLERILLFLLSKQLAGKGRHINNDDLPDIPWKTRMRASVFFEREVANRIHDFQRSEEEGCSLLAKLLECVAGRIAGSHHTILQRQERQEPKLIYGTARATDEIPFE